MKCSICGKDVECVVTTKVKGQPKSQPVCTKCMGKSPEVRRNLAAILGPLLDLPKAPKEFPEGEPR